MKTILIAISCLIMFNFVLPTSDMVICGHITDASSGNPIKGAAVTISGSDKGTVSDFGGYYELKLEQGRHLLIISMPGYKFYRMEVDSTQTIDIKLIATSNLDEVVNAEIMVISKPDNAGATERKYQTMPLHQGLVLDSESEPVWNTEDYDLIKENGFTSTDEQQLSTFSIDVDRASYSNIRRFISQGNRPPVDAVRIEEMINYFDYQYPGPQGNDPLAITTEFGICPWNTNHQLLHIGIVSEKIETENLPASNLVFLIDVSGSMAQQNKLPLLVRSFRLLVDQLRPQDHVSLVTYAGASDILLDGINGNDKERILIALEKLMAGGSTAGVDGIITAYRLAEKNFIENGNNRVILATDGDFNVGVSSDAELIRIIEKQRESGVYLSVLGFGMGNYKDNKLQKLADHGNGNHQYIDDLAEAKKVFIDEFGSNLFTVAKDVKIQIEFNPENVAGYRLLGYENRKMENCDFSDDRKDAGEIGNGHTVTILYEIIPSGTDSKWLTSVEKRYSETKPETGIKKDELAFLKLRYKKPFEQQSILMQHPISAIRTSSNKLSDNYYWAASVAGFGMMLRNSEFKQDSDIELVIELANKGLGKDRKGYRQDFIDLVKKANRIYLFDDEHQVSR